MMADQQLVDKIRNRKPGKPLDLYEANLSGANLFGADLHGADLHVANLSGANLTGANLTGAYLVYANLTGANLTGAELFGANLIGANLSEANLYNAKLDNATWSIRLGNDFSLYVDSKEVVSKLYKYSEKKYTLTINKVYPINADTIELMRELNVAMLLQ